MRIIPALAGNTINSIIITKIEPGSSPLSRGILHRNQSINQHWGIIPALAGNTVKGP